MYSYPNENRILKFAVISDLHISNDPAKEIRLKTLIEKINLIPNLKFVAITGDLVSSIYYAKNGECNDEENNRLIKTLNLLQKLKTPFYICMGNHDYKINNKRDSDAPFNLDEIIYIEKIWKEITGFDPFYHLEFENCSFIFLNSMRGRYLNKFFDDDQLEWLENILKKSNCTIIFSHYPPTENKLLSTFSPKNFITPKNEEKFFNILNKYKHKIKAIFCGHIHKKLHYQILNSIPVWIAESFADSKKTPFLLVEINLNEGYNATVKVQTKN